MYIDNEGIDAQRGISTYSDIHIIIMNMQMQLSSKLCLELLLIRRIFGDQYVEFMQRESV